MPYRPAWERYFGVALDFPWNKFNHPTSGHEYEETSSLGPSWAGDSTRSWGMKSISPAGGCHTSCLAGLSSGQRDPPFGDDSTDFGVVAEPGLEYFIIPQLSIGPSFRYRHVWLNMGRGPVHGLGSSGLPLLTGGWMRKLHVLGL